MGCAISQDLLRVEQVWMFKAREGLQPLRVWGQGSEARLLQGPEQLQDMLGKA